jgi:hypothetical protein
MSSFAEICGTPENLAAAIGLIGALLVSELLPFLKTTRCQGITHSLHLLLVHALRSRVETPSPTTSEVSPISGEVSPTSGEVPPSTGHGEQ